VRRAAVSDSTGRSDAPRNRNLRLKAPTLVLAAGFPYSHWARDLAQKAVTLSKEQGTTVGVLGCLANRSRKARAGQES